uniref:DUF148 domain-containing protein n=1 Tax=Globodera pallida TaxID=36090 RepID=A0A183CN68_GLOPA
MSQNDEQNPETTAGDVNTNLATLEAQITTLTERVDQIVTYNGHSRSQSPSDGFGNAIGNGHGFHDESVIIPVVPFVGNDPDPVNEINTLTGISGLEVFTHESVTAFDKWARRFRDYICVIGRSFGEQEKLDRLRLALDEIPRDLFDQLTAAETASVEEALKALRSKLDSPQRKELAKRSLALCKQREDESVGVFLKRLAPLVEVANSSLDPDQYKERLSEEFLDRLRPDLAFLIRPPVNNIQPPPQYLQGVDASPAQPSSSVMVDANELLRAFSAMKFPAAGTKQGNEPAPMNSISPVAKKESDGEAKEEETRAQRVQEVPKSQILRPNIQWSVKL